jgi:hypothetical protein
MTQYSDGRIYEITTPICGALFFKYNGTNSTFKSVDRTGHDLYVLSRTYDNTGLPIVVNPSTSNSPADQQLSLTVSEIKSMHYQVGLVDDCEIMKAFSNSSLGSGIMLNIDPKSGSNYSAHEMRAVIEDPIAMALYTCMQLNMPYLVTMANSTRCLSSTQISMDTIGVRHSQQLLATHVALEKMLDMVRNSKLMKWLRSPFFFIVLAAASIITMILSIFTAGGALVVLIVVLIGIAAAAGLLIKAGLAYKDDMNEMEHVKAELGYKDKVMPEELQEIYDAYKKALTDALIIMCIVVVISVIAGGKGSFGLKSAAKELAEKWIAEFEEEIVNEFLQKVWENAARFVIGSGIISSSILALSSVESGISSIVSGMMRRAVAAVDEAFTKSKAQVEQLSAMSKFFKELMSHMDQSLRKLLESIQELIKTQGEIIKTLGEGSRTVTRNIAGI